MRRQIFILSKELIQMKLWFFPDWFLIHFVLLVMINLKSRNKKYNIHLNDVLNFEIQFK